MCDSFEVVDGNLCDGRASLACLEWGLSLVYTVCSRCPTETPAVTREEGVMTCQSYCIHILACGVQVKVVMELWKDYFSHQT